MKSYSGKIVIIGGKSSEKKEQEVLVFDPRVVGGEKVSVLKCTGTSPGAATTAAFIAT